MNFLNIYIIGLGKIGKSIGNTLKNNSFKGKIFGYDNIYDNFSESIINEKFNINNINSFKDSVFFISTPQSLTEKYTLDLINIKKDSKDFIISDLCSVKNFLFKNKEISNYKNFISIHPMDGGFGGNKDFFFKKSILNYVIENKNQNSSKYSDFLREYLNFENIQINHNDHDKIVAIISHLTNIIEACLSENYENINSKLWQDILHLNRTNIEIAINDFILILKKHTNQKNINLDQLIKFAIEELITINNINIQNEFHNPSLKRVLNIEKNHNSRLDLDLFINNLKKFQKWLFSVAIIR